MANIPNKMEEAQIAYLANEIVKTYMTGRDTNSYEAFVQEYFNLYQQTIEIIDEEQKKQQMIQASSVGNLSNSFIR